MEYCLGYVTCANKREAEKIGKELVTLKLAACVNVHSESTSFYMWNGAITSSEECVLIVKTKTKIFKTVTEKICKMHSYSTPCVLQIPISVGNQSYKEFIDNNTL